MTTDPIPAAPAPPSPAHHRLWGLRSALREDRLFLLLAVVIGILAGLAVVCFRIVIELIRFGLLGSGLAPTPERVLLAPAGIGLVVGALVLWLFPGARGSGVNQTKAAVYIFDGHIPFRTVIGKFITSALAIGSGQSLGPEDPSLQIGAGLAAAIGERLRLSRVRMRLIAPVGAAAGLAAAFNAPIAAILFVIEEVIGRWSAGALGAVVLSAVASTAVARWFLGSEPLFRVPPFELRNPLELVAYAALGVIGGLASLVFVKWVGYLRPRLAAFPRAAQYVLPAAAGLLIGLIGLRFPQVMGAGYQFVDQALHGQYLWTTLAILAALKLVATTFSFASGTPGGMFAPTLFMGAMLGGAVGGAEHFLLPHLSAPVGAYALVGMGTMFAGILRAPMTSVFMIVEVSGSYSIVLPLMISNAIAYVISRALQPTPIFDLLTRQDGLTLPSMEEWREEQVLHVEDGMRPPARPPLAPHVRVAEALRVAEGEGQDFLLVELGAGRWGGIRRARLQELAGQGADGMPLAQAIPEALPALHPDQPLETFFREAGTAPLLPVLHRADNRLLGVVSLADALATYRHAPAGAEG